MMGIFLAFPIVTSSYFKKSNYIKQQIISSKVSKKSTLLNDTFDKNVLRLFQYYLTIDFIYYIV
ncbi:hypothetical protein [Anaerosalibacter sp. Marseille-P3206]|uniref:hypothetical protein n=1 Tax=Anaerosalibacter sp. Marseille-P3206 TaxID=1871005 RepID=UPI0013563733|nr:hypothetical protein [Anaerosalibacter sp. Marseille-P3206]